MQGRQLVMVVAVLVLVAGVAGGILWFLRRGKTDETATAPVTTQNAQAPAGTQPPASGGTAAVPPAGGAAGAPQPTGAAMGAGGGGAAPLPNRSDPFASAGMPAAKAPGGKPAAGAPGAGATPVATAAGAMPNRPDPFLPYDWVPPKDRIRIEPTVLDYGFPVAQRGPDPERETGDQPRVAAIAWDYQGKVFATIELEGQTYVVEPGDFVGTDIRVVSIDRTHNTVTLRKDNEVVELTLMPRAVTPGRP